MSRSIKLLTVAVLAIVLAASSAQSAFARPVVSSSWTSNPPTIDGSFPAGEWSNLQITMKTPDYPIDAYAYFLNDRSKLYVLVDVVGDTSDTSGDECLLVFDYSAQVVIDIIGSSDSSTWHKSSGPFTAAIGYGNSPNTPATAHKIYEFAIPLSSINLTPGGSVDVCSPFFKGLFSLAYDSATGKDNLWPPGIGTGSGWRTDISLWGTLTARSPPTAAPVGGFLEPVNKLDVFAPYLVLFGATAAVAIVVWKRPEN